MLSDRKDGMSPEDYTDPACPFCTDGYAKEPPVHPIPLNRVLGKLDDYFSTNDYEGADRHLLYWIREAEANRDEGGAFSLRNERMGLLRRCGRMEEAVREANETLRIAEKLGFMERTEGGTALLNAATVYKAAGRAEESMSLFSRAEELYRRLLPPDDERMGGLYNNMALTLVDLGRFSEARTCYSEAIRVMSLQKNGKPETAITWLNLASLSESEFGLESDEAQEEISACLRNASDLLEQEKDRTDGGYAFVCEKCAPVFGRYGYFWMEEELNERARRIYQRA